MKSLGMPRFNMPLPSYCCALLAMTYNGCMALLRGKCKEAAFSKLILTLKEQQFQGRQWPSIDKAFACAWLNGQQVLVGTKCNKLLLLNVDPHTAPHIPAFQEIPLPCVNPRPLPPPPLPARVPEAVQENPWNSDMLLRSASWSSNWEDQHDEWSWGSEEGVEDEERLEEVMSSQASGDLNDHSQDDWLEPPPADSGRGFGVGHGGVQTVNCGMHCISLSTCRTLVACGGAEPNDCQTFKVEERTDGSLHLTPAQTLVEHKDWLFSSAWVTDRHLVTGSRDTSLKLWTVDPDDKAVNTHPLCTQYGNNGKVRDVKYMERQQLVASLAVDGSVQTWSAHLDPITSVATPYEREVVCMAAADSLLAVGSRNHVSLVDPRLSKCLSSVANVDHNQGVRSLAFSHHLLSLGGGQGKIHFLDLRVGKFLEAQDPFLGVAGGDISVGRAEKSFCLQTGEGHLSRNETYREHFEGMDIRNACYAHAWDPVATRLLMVGGPLAFGLRGTYAALWQ